MLGGKEPHSEREGGGTVVNDRRHSEETGTIDGLFSSPGDAEEDEEEEQQGMFVSLSQLKNTLIKIRTRRLRSTPCPSSSCHGD